MIEPPDMKIERIFLNSTDRSGKPLPLSFGEFEMVYFRPRGMKAWMMLSMTPVLKGKTNDLRIVEKDR